MSKQTGFVTLILSLTLLILLTGVTLYAVQTGVGKQRIVANEVRHREAKSDAANKLERAASWLYQQTAADLQVAADWTLCANSPAAGTTGLPCFSPTDTGEGGVSYFKGSDNWIYYTGTVTDSDGTSINDVYVAAKCLDICSSTIPDMTAGSIFPMAAKGTSVDATAESWAQQGIAYVRFLGNPVDAPLISGSAGVLKGGLELIDAPRKVADDETETAGRLAVWSGTPFTDNNDTPKACDGSGPQYIDADDLRADVPGLTFKRCDTCACSDNSNSAITTWNDDGIFEADEVDDQAFEVSDPQFPTDLFKYVFNGTSRDNYTLIKNSTSTQTITDCSTLDDTYSGLLWVEGDCNLPNADVGTGAAPIILVVENGKLTVNGNSILWGMAYVWEHDGVDSGVSLAGDAKIYGALVIDRDIESNDVTLAGTPVIWYSSEVLGRLGDSKDVRAAPAIPGTRAGFF